MQEIAEVPALVQFSGMRPSDRLDWDDLKLLLALAEWGVVARAAEQLRTDPTTVTRRLRRLEDLLDRKLVERIKGGVVLTRTAQDLVELARVTETGLNSALGAEGRVDVAGVVKLSGTDFALDLVAADLARLSAAHPGLVFDLRPTNSYLSFERRETDVAIRIAEAPHEGLVGRRLGRLTLGFYAPVALAERALALPWLSWNLPMGLTTIDAAIAARDSEGRIVARVDSMMAQARLAATGMAAAVLPDAYVAAHAELSNLVRIGDAGDVGAWVLTHEELRDVPRVKIVMRALVEAFGEMDGRAAG